MTFFYAGRTLLVAVLGAMLLPVSLAFGQAAPPKSDKPSWVDRFFGIKHDRTGGWLFAGHKSDGKDGVYFAISKDGYRWRLVNDGRPMLKPSQHGEVTLDPFVQRAPDGTFRMIWTWSRGAPATVGYSTSDNLAFWSEQRKLPIAAGIPTAENAWSPSMYYEPARKDWLILWSSSVPATGKPANAPDNTPDNRIYSTTTTDFKRFAPAKLFFDPGYPVADATLLPSNDKAGEFYLLFKDDREGALGKNIRMAQGSAIDGPWQNIGAPFAENGSEAPAVLPVAGGYLAYYDLSTDPHHYEAMFSTDLQHWSYATPKIAFPAGLRHGSFMHIETSEYNLLLDYHQLLDSGSIK
jgi:hypothetical protein